MPVDLHSPSSQQDLVSPAPEAGWELFQKKSIVWRIKQKNPKCIKPHILNAFNYNLQLFHRSKMVVNLKSLKRNAKMCLFLQINRPWQ